MRPNVQQMVQQAMQNGNMMNNPVFSNAVGMYRNHNSEGLRNIADNLCRENGTTYEEMRRKLGV